MYIAKQLAKESGRKFSWFTPIDFDLAAKILESEKNEIYKIGHCNLKTSLKMNLLYCLDLLENPDQNRHMIHKLTRSMHTFGNLWDTQFLAFYCKNKKIEMETAKNKGNSRTMMELRRVHKISMKIKALLKYLWRLASEEKEDFSKFPSIVTAIENLEEKAENILKDIMKREPENYHVLRAYGLFESEIKRNFLKAEYYFCEADLLEDQASTKHEGTRPRGMSVAEVFKNALSNVISHRSDSSRRVQPYEHDTSVNDVPMTNDEDTQTEVDDDEPKFKYLTQSETPLSKKRRNSNASISSESHRFSNIRSIKQSAKELKLMEELRCKVEKSSFSTINLIKVLLILLAIVGNSIYFLCFLNSKSMLDRFGVSSESIKYATRVRKLLIEIVQVSRNLFNNIGDFKETRELLNSRCHEMEHLTNQLYKRSLGTNEAAIWRQPDAVTLQHFYDDSNTVIYKSTSLYDGVQTFIKTCFDLSNLSKDMLIANSLKYKFLSLNGPSTLVDALDAISEIMLRTELKYRDDFRVHASILPTLMFVLPTLVFIPTVILFYREQKNGFKLLKLVKKSVISYVYHSISLNQHNETFSIDEQDAEKYMVLPRAWTYFISFLLFMVLMFVIASVLSVLGILASSTFTTHNKFVNVGGKVSMLIDYVDFGTTELLAHEKSFFTNDTLIHNIRMKMDEITFYFNGMRFGNHSLELPENTDLDSTYNHLFYGNPCNDTNDLNCLSTLQAMTLYFELTDRILLNYSDGIGDKTFLQNQKLLANILQSKMGAIVDSFIHKSSQNTEPISIAIIAILAVAIPMANVLFFFNSFLPTSRLGKELKRGKKLLLFLPVDVIYNCKPILNYLNDRSYNFNVNVKSVKKHEQVKLRSMLSKSPDAVIEFSQDLLINSVNKSAEKMFMLDPIEMKGKRIETLFTAETVRDFVRWAKEKTFNNSNTPFEGEMIAICSKFNKDEYFPVRVIAMHETESKIFGSKLSYIAFIRNISHEQKQKELLQTEKQISQELLWNILPKKIAEKTMTHKDKIIVDCHSEVSMIFADIVNFTMLSSSISPEQLISTLNDVFSAFDELAPKYHIEKIKTIGDCYFCACGVPEYRLDHAVMAMEFAIEMLNILEKLNENREVKLQLRIGINSGPVVAGVIGKSKFCYDLWGDAVNVASRMESTGETGKIQISRDTYVYLYNKYNFREKDVQVKGKGLMKTYIYVDRKDPLLVTEKKTEEAEEEEEEISLES